MMQITVPTTQLEPLVKEVIRQAVTEFRQLDLQTNNRLAFSEAEAAALLGLHRHVLRDLRQRGEINHSRGPGKRILYCRKHLEDYLMSREVRAKNME